MGKTKAKPLEEIPPHATEGSDGLLYLDPNKVRKRYLILLTVVSLISCRSI